MRDTLVRQEATREAVQYADRSSPPVLADDRAATRTGVSLCRQTTFQARPYQEMGKCRAAPGPSLCIVRR